MSDFMKWLYANYIRPQLDAVPHEDYHIWLSLMEDELDSSFQEDFDKSMEVTAIHAFLLGLRTGRGLPL